MRTGPDGPGAGRIVRLLLVLCAVFAGGALRAHEVQPSVASLETEGQAVRLDLRINAEALLTGIDLDAVTDTNQSEGSDDYDSLRQLPPAEVEGRLRAAWDRIGQGIGVETSEGEAVPLDLGSIETSEIGDASISRPTRVLLEGRLPQGASGVIVHWGDGQGTLILRHVGVEDGYAGYLEGGQSSPALDLAGGAEQSWISVFTDYIPIGFDHILPKGLDHILFVLGLFFLSPRMRPLLLQITAFTVAHTVSLALGVMGWVNVPGSIVEPLIAASIVFVAVENLLSDRLHRWRPVVVFCFGLLHGLGFASVLMEFGLPEGQFVPALLGFNLGVEFGQLTVVALAFLAVGAWFGRRSWYRAAIAMPASVAIGAIGVYWFFERAIL